MNSEDAQVKQASRNEMEPKLLLQVAFIIELQ